jgi:hypothetical protein
LNGMEKLIKRMSKSMIATSIQKKIADSVKKEDDSQHL